MENKIATISLNYVRLLSAKLAKKFIARESEVNQLRIDEPMLCNDNTLEVSAKDLLSVQDNLKYTRENEEITDFNICGVTVPLLTNKGNQLKLDTLTLVSKTAKELKSYSREYNPIIADLKCIYKKKGLMKQEFNNLRL